MTNGGHSNSRKERYSAWHATAMSSAGLKRWTPPVPGADTRVIYHHELDGPAHRVQVEVLGEDAVGKPVKLRLAPFFHQGWDHKAPGKHR